MKMLFILLFLMSQKVCLFSQTLTTEERAGKVTFQSSQNTYAGFESTEGIKQNDTLFIKKDNAYLPAVRVSFISSRSCAGPPIGNVVLKPGDELIARVKVISEKPEERTGNVKEGNIIQVQKSEDEKSGAITPLKAGQQETMLTGRISLQSYSSFSNLPGSINTQRWRYTLSSEAKNLWGSDLYFSSYMTFSYNTREWKKTRNNIGNSLRVYDFSLQYDLTSSLHMRAGRYINPKISSISSIDGLQAEKKWDSYYGGLVAGSRPDFANFGYNIKLFEAGAYFGRSDTLQRGVMNNTLAFFNQTNNFKTDRRFLYFQHDNYIFTDLNFFLSSEIDLYKREQGQAKNALSLTSLYFMSRYSPMRWLSLSLSYDARKNVIYYETFRNIADSLFDKETRQGVRGGIMLRPFSTVFMGFDAGYRFEKNDIRPSRNFSGYLSWASVPLLDMTISLNGTNLVSSYVEGFMYGGTLYKDLFNSLLSASLGYRRVEYTFISVTDKLREDILSVDLSLLMMKNIYLITSYEGEFSSRNTSGRVLIEVSSRF